MTSLSSDKICALLNTIGTDDGDNIENLMILKLNLLISFQLKMEMLLKNENNKQYNETQSKFILTKLPDKGVVAQAQPYTDSEDDDTLRKIANRRNKNGNHWNHLIRYH